MQKRLRLPGLDSRRADLIVAGRHPARHHRPAAGRDRRDPLRLRPARGLVLDYIARNQKQIVRTDRYPDIRRRSVVELGERCRWYPEHSEQVARLALSLYDQSRGLHGGGEREREWLEYAALLHDIGGHISYLGHHRHSYYLIRNGGLRGFDPEEIEAIALMARYHRRGRPKKSHAALGLAPQANPPRGAHSARHCFASPRASIGATGRWSITSSCSRAGDRFCLVVRSRGPVELERWAAHRQLRPLSKTARPGGRD